MGIRHSFRVEKSKSVELGTASSFPNIGILTGIEVLTSPKSWWIIGLTRFRVLTKCKAEAGQSIEDFSLFVKQQRLENRGTFRFDLISRSAGVAAGRERKRQRQLYLLLCLVGCIKNRELTFWWNSFFMKIGFLSPFGDLKYANQS